MALTVLKNTPIHTVIAVSGTSATETITLASLATASQTPGSPVVHIKAIHWSVPAGTATITRNGVTLWSLTYAYQFEMAGYADNREATSSIVIATPAGGGTIIIELMKISGYGDSQHINPLT